MEVRDCWSWSDGGRRLSESEGDGGVSGVEREEAGGACCARGEVAKLGAIQRVERIEGQFRVKRSVVVRFSGHGEGGWRFKYKGFYVCAVPPHTVPPVVRAG